MKGRSEDSIISNELRLQALDKRLSALEHPDEHIDPTRANGEYVTNPCGCVLPKDRNVSHHASALQETPQGTLCICLYQCLKCMRVIKIWHEVRVKKQPLVLIPGSSQ